MQHFQAIFKSFLLISEKHNFYYWCYNEKKIPSLNVQFYIDYYVFLGFSTNF